MGDESGGTGVRIGWVELLIIVIVILVLVLAVVVRMVRMR